MHIRPGDCLAILPTIPDNSIDAIVTDPPYHLTGNQGRASRAPEGMYTTMRGGFMGKQWDGGDIAFRPDVWRECLRVLKPGGYMIAFGGTRTYHRMATAIEDAGFVLHPMLVWAFGSGFPKATNASKQIDKHLGAEREVVGTNPNARTSITGYKNDGRTMINALSDAEITAPATPEARQWDGWAYGLQSLKPALEPICMVQKPMIGTGAQNILKHGVGAVNIDACRVGTDDPPRAAWGGTDTRDDGGGMTGYDPTKLTTVGRWPPNLLHDGSDEVVECFPQSKSSDRTRNSSSGSGIYNPSYAKPFTTDGYADEGSAARFFPDLGYTEADRLMYCPKANKQDRNGSKHPTIKPIRLLEWLCKLITPPDGTVLDPFAGSGTTGQACKNLGFECILIEREAEYVKDIERRFAPLTVP